MPGSRANRTSRAELPASLEGVVNDCAVRTLQTFADAIVSLPHFAGYNPANVAAVAVHHMALCCASSMGATWKMNGLDPAPALESLQRDIAQAYEDGITRATLAAVKAAEPEVPRG